MRKVFSFAVLLISVVLLTACQSNTGSKCVEIEVVYADENVEEVVSVCTDVETVEELLTEQEEVEVDLTESSMGSYVSGMAGYNFEEEGLSLYWAIYVNGEYAMVGISELLVNDGDVYKFEATGW